MHSIRSQFDYRLLVLEFVCHYVWTNLYCEATFASESGQRERPQKFLKYVDEIDGLVPQFKEKAKKVNWLDKKMIEEMKLPRIRVYDQGDTVCCFIFCPTNLREYRHCLQQHREGREDIVYVTISRQHVWNCMFYDFRKPPGMEHVRRRYGWFYGQDTWTYQFAYSIGIRLDSRVRWTGDIGSCTPAMQGEYVMKIRKRVFLRDNGKDPYVLKALRCTPLMGAIPISDFLYRPTVEEDLFDRLQRILTLGTEDIFLRN